jgi:hypothetical protein
MANCQDPIWHEFRWRCLTRKVVDGRSNYGSSTAFMDHVLRCRRGDICPTHDEHGCYCLPFWDEGLLHKYDLLPEIDRWYDDVVTPWLATPPRYTSLMVLSSTSR